MIGILVFHALMLGLVLGVASRAISTNSVSNLLGYLHQTIGITAPAADKVRLVALIWVGSAVIIVDGCVFLLVFISSELNVG
jgi:hypothetical protein